MSPHDHPTRTLRTVLAFAAAIAVAGLQRQGAAHQLPV